MAQTTFTDGQVLTATLLNTYCAGEGGAWTSWTPQVDQGASTNIAKTVTYSKYARYGRMITWSFQLSMTASGTAGSNVTVSLPVTAVAAANTIGSGVIYDASVSFYTGCWMPNTTGTVIFVANGETAYWGTDPNVGLVSGDVLYGSITYEAAS